ncbi:MAG: bifunctional 4-hydroxy-2-oxoglutarate aldolase/2-dehydro-3-deoxy-phosphogluconate aldolase [Verrucomicrobiales bacterium]
MMKSKFPSELLERIESCGVIAVLVIDKAEHAVPLAEALLVGGVEVMELTLRTPAALPALVEIKREVPAMVAGVGTILSVAQVDEALEAGADFGVSPGVNPAVVERAAERGLPFAPGIMTPSDIEQAVALGCRELKFFPAETSGGLDHLTGIAAPYAHLGLHFIPLGGISSRNMLSYLGCPCVPAVGGSWIAPRDMISGGDWGAIRARAENARRVIDDARGDSGKGE